MEHCLGKSNSNVPFTPMNSSSERGRASSERGRASSERGRASSERGRASSERGRASSGRGRASSGRGRASSGRGRASSGRGRAGYRPRPGRASCGYDGADPAAARRGRAGRGARAGLADPRGAAPAGGGVPGVGAPARGHAGYQDADGRGDVRPDRLPGLALDPLPLLADRRRRGRGVREAVPRLAGRSGRRAVAGRTPTPARRPPTARTSR